MEGRRIGAPLEEGKRMDKRRRDLDSVRRLAEWATNVENEGEWVGRRTGTRYGMGPVVELELGYRGAAYFLSAPSSGVWHDLAMSK